MCIEQGERPSPSFYPSWCIVIIIIHFSFHRRTNSKVKSRPSTSTICPSCKRCTTSWRWRARNGCPIWRCCKISSSRRPLNSSGSTRKRRLKFRATGLPSRSTSPKSNATTRYFLYFPRLFFSFFLIYSLKKKKKSILRSDLNWFRSKIFCVTYWKRWNLSCWISCDCSR